MKNTKVTVQTEDIKSRFITAAVEYGQAGAKLRELAQEARDDGFDRDDIKEWLKEAGYDDAYASRLTSSLFLEVGKRARKSGAGPAVSPEAVELAAYVAAKYGENALKTCRAAVRLLAGQTGTNVASKVTTLKVA